MTRPRPRPTIVVAALCLAAFCAAAFAPARAEARKPAKSAKAPPPPSADQQEVVAAIVADTFPRPKREPLMLSLCLDVDIAPAVDEDAPPPPRRRGKLKRAVAIEQPPPRIIRGAPAELVTRLARPWRVVASALTCRLDPRRPIALGDAGHTPAQLVTVHLVPDVAAGTSKIEWTEGADATAANSRDCTAARGPRGWSVRCGGTWFQ